MKKLFGSQKQMLFKFYHLPHRNPTNIHSQQIHPKKLRVNKSFKLYHPKLTDLIFFYGTKKESHPYTFKIWKMSSSKKKKRDHFWQWKIGQYRP